MKRKSIYRTITHIRTTTFIIFVVILSISNFTRAETFYVDQNHPLASDNNPGTESEPFLSVQKGINSANAHDTVFVKVGTYNLSGFSKNLDQPISIFGQRKDSTIFDSIGTLNIIGTSGSNIFTLENVKFTNYEGSIFNLTVADGDTLNGLYISNCIFDKIEGTSKTRLFLGRYDVSPFGIVTNINISNCDFLGITAPGVKYIYIYEGIISNINIINNNFYNLVSNSDTRGAVAIYVGTNSNLLSNKNIQISGNFIDTIVADTMGGTETHGILTYGENIQIINNTIRDMTPGEDHEAIYMKGSYSVIENNVLLNCTSHQGAIAIKGSGKSFHDTIRNNRVQSNQEGRSIYTAGPESITIENNYIKNTNENSTDGLYIYAANGSSCFMKNNYSQTGRNAAYMHDVGGGDITDNTLISYNAQTIKLTGTTSNIFINGNIEYSGWPIDQPLAMASADIIQGESPLYVNFTNAGSNDPNGEIVSYEWNFHNGNTSTQQNPSHIFTEVRTYTVTLIVTDADGYKDLAYVIIQVNDTADIVGIESNTSLKENLKLNIFPNPFNSFTNIAFSIPVETKVLIDVHDINGNLVKRIHNGNLLSGKYEKKWDGRNEGGFVVPPGIYLIKCSTDELSQCKQVVLIK